MIQKTAATIVVFGASGDLTSRKLIPALFDNFCKGRLNEQTRIVGVSRTEMTDEDYRGKLYNAASETLGKTCTFDCWKEFAARIHYCSGDVSQAGDYTKLENRLREIEGSTANGRLYYLALAPQLYEPLIEQLGAAGMADESNSWRRIVFEKPFGHDLESAHRLNASIHSVFSESQVFRIDHYLGKETVQNLLVLRFANSIFEPIWNRNYIDHVQITMAETTLVGSRGGYYDQAGILRDMFQNHMFQILSLIAMEPPSRYSASALHNEKVKVLHAIRPPKPEQIEMYSVLGQYQGYHSERGVSADSITPTFAALRLDIDNWRWQGVPFFLRSGKGMPGKTTEAIIQFRCPPHMIFDAPDDPSSSCNQLLITIQPDEGIHITFHTKVPDSGMAMKQSKLYFHYRDSYPINAIPDAYERLLLDALNGDSSLFIREDEIELAWKLIDPVIEGWRNRGDKPYSYNKGTWGPTEADTLIKCAGRNWVNGASFDHD